jgi:small-conductance mechanosensitive channel
MRGKLKALLVSLLAMLPLDANPLVPDGVSGRAFAKKYIESAADIGRQLAQGSVDTDTRIGHAAQVQTVITVVVIAAASMIGLVIVGEMFNLLPDTGVDSVNNTTEDVLGGVTDGFGFIPIIILVLFASIVIAVVRNF